MITWNSIAAIFSQLEEYLIGSLVRNVARHKEWEKQEGFTWEAWQATKLKELRQYQLQNKNIVNKTTINLNDNTKTMLQEQFAEGYKEVSEFAERVKYKPQAPPGTFFGVNPKRTNALIDGILTTQDKVQRAALRKMDDVYRQTVYKSALGMSTGMMTLPQAIDSATKDFLASGINCIQYKDGRQVNIASYTEMALRAAATRAKLYGEGAKRKELGIDTVLVSQYGACSNTCLPWQGKVYIDDVFMDFEGEKKGSFGHSSNGKWYMLLSVAIKAGLYHPNCRHTQTTWIEGISRKPQELEAAIVEKVSALEQRQRSLERDVRKWKRMAEGFQQPTLASVYKRKATDAQRQLQAFINEHSDVLRRDYWREQTNNVPLAIKQQNDILKLGIQDQSVLTLNPEKQGKHIIGSDTYTKGRSYLTVSAEETQQLVNQYAGTGAFDTDINGKFKNRELIVADKQIGVSVNNITGHETLTNHFYIHYSKTGTHIVPTLKGVNKKNESI